jgi:hypothetical protein
MAVPANVVVAWPSTAASIPAGWTRVTELDSRYVAGAATGADTDLSTSRGNANHTHTSPAHTPIQNSHTHLVTDNGYLGPDNFSAANTPRHNVADSIHQHGSADSDAKIATNNSVTITVNTTVNDLGYLEVIWIKSNGTPLGLPIGCIAFFASDSLPTNWSRTAAGKYLKGAAAAGNGGASGGANTHVHTSPAHTHTQNAHTGTATTGNSDTFTVVNNTFTTTFSAHTHNHHLTFSSVTATNQSVTTTIDSTNHEPLFTFLNAITPSIVDLPVNVICLWSSTNASIPSLWARYTALDGRWAKCSSVNGDVLTTGGSSSHSHTASNCQPIQDAHTHTATDGGPQQLSTGKDSLNNTPDASHTHDWNVDSTTATNQATTVTIDSCAAEDAYPLYRTMIFVQFTNSTGPAISLGGYTSYDLGLTVADISNPVTPEVAAKIAHNDHRFMRTT